MPALTPQQRTALRIRATRGPLPSARSLGRAYGVAHKTIIKALAEMGLRANGKAGRPSGAGGAAPKESGKKSPNTP